jgi:hypothetical protein
MNDMPVLQSLMEHGILFFNPHELQSQQPLNVSCKTGRDALHKQVPTSIPITGINAAENNDVVGS